jgi:hypothetical protein
MITTLSALLPKPSITALHRLFSWLEAKRMTEATKLRGQGRSQVQLGNEVNA